MEEDERGKKYSLFSISGFELFQTEVVEQISSNCCSNVLLTMTNNNHCCFNYLDWNNPTKSYFHFYLWENYGLYLCRSVTCARNKSAHIWRKREGHDIASVACIRCALLSRFDVPKRTKKIKREVAVTWLQMFRGFLLDKSTHQVMSPLLVTIWLSSRNRQQLRYPVWPGSSRLTRTFPSRVFKL